MLTSARSLDAGRPRRRIQRLPCASPYSGCQPVSSGVNPQVNHLVTTPIGILQRPVQVPFGLEDCADTTVFAIIRRGAGRMVTSRTWHTRLCWRQPLRPRDAFTTSAKPIPPPSPSGWPNCRLRPSPLTRTQSSISSRTSRTTQRVFARKSAIAKWSQKRKLCKLHCSAVDEPHPDVTASPA